MADFLTGVITGIGANLSDIDDSTNYSLMMTIPLINSSYKKMRNITPDYSLMIIPGYLIGGLTTKAIRFINQEPESMAMKQKQEDAKIGLISITLSFIMLGIPTLAAINKN